MKATNFKGKIFGMWYRSFRGSRLRRQKKGSSLVLRWKRLWMAGTLMKSRRNRKHSVGSSQIGFWQLSLQIQSAHMHTFGSGYAWSLQNYGVQCTLPSFALGLLSNRPWKRYRRAGGNVSSQYFYNTEALPGEMESDSSCWLLLSALKGSSRCIQEEMKYV